LADPLAGYADNFLGAVVDRRRRTAVRSAGALARRIARSVGLPATVVVDLDRLKTVCATGGCLIRPLLLPVVKLRSRGTVGHAAPGSATRGATSLATSSSELNHGVGSPHGPDGGSARRDVNVGRGGRSAHRRASACRGGLYASAGAARSAWQPQLRELPCQYVLRHDGASSETSGSSCRRIFSARLDSYEDACRFSPTALLNAG
jgi:hypothetical protein